MPERVSRTPMLAGFGALGLFWGAWASTLPAVQRAVGASKGALGVALLFVAVGSLPAMLFLARPAFARFGGRGVAAAGAILAVVATLPGLAVSLPILAVTLALAGGATGVFDVGLNSQVSLFESATGRRLMPLAHGLYSSGILTGAVSAGIARGAGVGREPILCGAALTIAAASVVLARSPAPTGAARAERATLGRALLAIGLIGAAAFLVEGAIENWSALFLERQLQARPIVSGLGPGIFGAAMATGRFLGQGAGRIPDRLLLAGGALAAAGGCVIVAAAPNAPVAIAGFAIGGLGISLNAPIVFGAAGRGRSDPAGAVATVTAIGYTGIFLGPPLVGGLAQIATLRGSFLALAVIAAAVAAAATRLRL